MLIKFYEAVVFIASWIIIASVIGAYFIFTILEGINTLL